MIYCKGENKRRLDLLIVASSGSNSECAETRRRKKAPISRVWFQEGVFRIYGKVLGIYLKYFSTPSLSSALKWEAWTSGDDGMGDPDHQHGAGPWAWVRINFCLYYFIFY